MTGPLDLSKFPQTDSGGAEAFVAAYGDRFRHVRERRQWLALENGRWRRDRTGEPNRAALATVRALLQEAVKIEDWPTRRDAVKYYLAGESAARLRTLLERAETVLPIPITEDDLDTDPFLLSCANGTIDLRTGELRPHDPADLISLGTEITYDPDATCPRWLQFLNEVFGDDHELIGFVRRASGYSLTGDTRERKLFMPHGSGCNGKGVFVETMKLLLGDLAKTASFESFVRISGPRGVRDDLAYLHRARFVVANESNDGRRLDEAVVKLLTGDVDTVTVRHLFARYFEFRPTFKLWLCTNFLPHVDGTDDAIWTRISKIPFTVSFEGREDRHLLAKLHAERAAILTWAVAGCLEWQRHGLGTAAAVEQANREYREDEDVLGAFLAELCVMGSELCVSTTDLRGSYEEFCRQLGEKPMAASVLGKQLKRRGIHSKVVQKERVYEGLGAR